MCMVFSLSIPVPQNTGIINIITTEIMIIILLFSLVLILFSLVFGYVNNDNGF